MALYDYVAQRNIAATIASGYEGMIADTAPWHFMSGFNATRQSVTVTPTATNAATYTLNITTYPSTTAVAYTYTADASATVAEITAGLAALVNAGVQPVTAVDNTTTLSLNADNFGDAGAFTVAFAGTGVMVQATASNQNDSLPVGKLVRLDSALFSDDKGIRLPTAAGDITTSFLVAGVITATANGTKILGVNASIPGGTLVDVMRKGHVLVKVEQAVTPGQQAFVRYAAGGLGLGSFGNTTGTSERAALAGSVFRSTAAINGLAVLELNLVA